MSPLREGIKTSIAKNVGEAVERAKFPPPLLGWYQSTDYMRAFIVASTVSALVVPVATQIEALLTNVRVPAGKRFLVGIIVTFTASMIVLVTMRLLFGTGGSLLASRDRAATFWHPSSPL